MAIAIGAQVNIIEIDDKQIEKLQKKYSNNDVNIIKSTNETIKKSCIEADVVISTILIPGANPPKLITKEIVNLMKDKSIIIDVSSDQGGTCETLTRATSHEKPIEIIDGVLHYAVPNMPVSVPRTATNSIQGVIDLIIQLNARGLSNIEEFEEIMSGVQVKDGKYYNQKLV